MYLEYCILEFLHPIITFSYKSAVSICDIINENCQLNHFWKGFCQLNELST